MKRFAVPALFASLLFLGVFCQVGFAQTPTSSQTRDPQALGLLQASAAAMAQSSPSDSVATGTVTLAAGPTVNQGTIRILTKGTAETAVQVQTSASSWSVTYSNSLASRTDGPTTNSLYLEQAASSRCIYFPYPVIADLLTNPDAAFTYIGQETSAQGTVQQHIQAWNTYASNPMFQFLASFTVLDIWLDATSGLPNQIAFTRRSGGGSAPRIPVTISYSNYQNTGGALYPYSIQESVNGTVSTTVTIQSVTFNSGLSDSNFTVTAGAN